MSGIIYWTVERFLLADKSITFLVIK